MGENLWNFCQSTCWHVNCYGLCRSCAGSYVVETSWEQHAHPVQKKLSCSILFLRLLQSFHPHFHNVAWFLGVGVVILVSYLEQGTPKLLIFFILMRCGANSFYHCKKRNFFGWDVRAAISYGYKDQYLEGNWKQYCFSKMAVLGSSPGAMSSQAIGSWLSLQCWICIPSNWVRFRSNYTAVDCLWDTDANIIPLEICCQSCHCCDSQAR